MGRQNFRSNTNKKKIMLGLKIQGFGHLTLGPWIQKLALVLYMHYKIKLGKKEKLEHEDGEQD